ncbi:MAG TPA: sterol desaturase family protein [Gemmatimonadales bacterium]|nr:sterol desaturase family protein [Gemmatimonadales bacterium]
MNGVELWTLVAVVAAGIGFSVLERRFPYNAGQHWLRAGFWNDLLLYGFVQSYVLGVVIGRLILWMDGATGMSRLHLVSGWPIALQIAFFVVTHDLYIYLFHRLQHHTPWLWRLHEAHHSVKDVDWLSGVRSHSLEIFINQTIEFAPIVLLGAAPSVAVIKGAIGAIWGMFIHSNLDVRLGRLQYVINGPEMHRWHHATTPEAQGRNFSTKFAFWDWLFGTAYFPDRSVLKAGPFGLTDRQYPEDFPVAYFVQHRYPFVPEHPPADALEKAGHAG